MVPAVFGVAIFRYPVATDRELVVAEHIDHRDFAYDGTEEVGALHHTGRDKEPAIATPIDCQARGVRIVVGDESFGGGDEVVEDVLFLLQHSCLVPVLAILVATAQIRYGIDASVLYPQ